MTVTACKFLCPVHCEAKQTKCGDWMYWFVAGPWKDMGGCSCPPNLKILEGFQQITFFVVYLKKINCPHPYHLWVLLFSLSVMFTFVDCMSNMSVEYSTPGFPVLHHLPELAQTHVHWVGDAIQPSHHLLSLLLLPSIFPSIKVFSNESAHSIRLARVLGLQLQHLSFQWIFRVDL